MVSRPLACLRPSIIMAAVGQGPGGRSPGPLSHRSPGRREMSSEGDKCSANGTTMTALAPSLGSQPYRRQLPLFFAQLGGPAMGPSFDSNSGTVVILQDRSF